MFRLMRVVLLIALLLCEGSPDYAAAQDRGRDCLVAYNSVVQGNPDFAQLDPGLPNGCQLVAVALEQQWAASALFRAEARPEDVAATRGQTTSTPVDASPSVEPVEAAGGSLAAVGAEDGASALAALAVNPSIFFIDSSDTEAVAQWSRVSDFTVLLPVQETNEEEDDESLEYMGVRWGISITGLSQGRYLHDEVIAAYDRFNAMSTPAIIAVRDLLLSGAQLEPCIRTLTERHTLTEADRATITTLCGGFPILNHAIASEALQERIREARIRADSRYLGLDLRADFGDLSLAAIDTVRGTSLFAGLGAGRRFSFRENTTAGIRGHVGARYWDREGVDGVSNLVEGGIAFEAIRYYDLQRLTLLGGIDLQHASDRDDPTTLTLSAALNVPVASTTSVTVNLLKALAGEQIGPTISIKANWRVLWSAGF